MTVIERYKNYRSGNQKSYSAIARSYDNSAIDNFINARQQQKQDFLDNQIKIDQKEIEKAATAAIEKTIKQSLK